MVDDIKMKLAIKDKVFAGCVDSGAPSYAVNEISRAQVLQLLSQTVSVPGSGFPFFGGSIIIIFV